MAKTCIICGNPAGSREHVFPAALGGRRTNKGIYCKIHNNGFSPLVSILSQQLSMINAILCVRPDRASIPKAFHFNDREGERLALLGSKINIAPPPPVDQLKIATDGTYAIKVSSMDEFYRWRDEQNAAGFDVRLSSRQEEARQQYFTAPLSVRLTLGGKDGLRAIGYLALTFFAQHFQNEARQSGLDEFKSYIQEESSFQPDLVWWDERDSIDVIGTNPYKFGHAIVVAVSAKEKQAYAYVTLFSALNFGVSLGAIDVAEDMMVTVHINPQAESAPDDIGISKSANLNIEVRSGNSGLAAIINSGVPQQALQRLLNDASNWHLAQAASDILAELEAVRSDSELIRHATVKAIVDRLSQRVLNLLVEAVNNLKDALSEIQNISTFFALLDELVASDETSLCGLSVSAQVAVGIAKESLTAVIEDYFVQGKLTEDRLAMLIGGGEGIALVTESVIMPIAKIISPE